MGPKIKAIIKRTCDPVGTIQYIENDIRAFQSVVGGYVESVQIGSGPSVYLLCNEDGKLLDLERNFYIKHPRHAPELIVGDVAVVGADGIDIADVPITLDCWRRMLRNWGN